VDCGYGLTGQLGQVSQQEMERLRQGAVLHDSGSHAADGKTGGADMQAEARERMRAGAEALEGSESALRRSLEAESALQAEVALLRERSSQLSARLEETRRVYATGVQQMLRPVQDYFAAKHLDVPFDALIPEMLKELVSRPAPREVSGVTRRDLEEVAARTDDLRGVVHSCTRRLEVIERLIAERLPLSTGAQAYDGPTPQSYDTFVMSDARSAEIERAILDAQTSTGRPYAG